MRLSQNTLLIVANPFAAPLSAEGRCTALCPADPAEGGGRYVGASTRATVRKQPAGMRSPFGTRDKVSVMYALAPVKVADTSYYRAALKSGDVISVAEVSVMPVGRSKIEVRAEGIAGAAQRVAAALGEAACASLAAFVADGGDRSKALAEWRKQGLASIADAIDPPQPDKAPPGALPPGDDTLKTAPGISGPMIAIEVKAGEIGVLSTEGVVS